MRGVRRGLWMAAFGGALGGIAPSSAQVAATTDVAFGAVRYDGFLGSAAASVTPGIRYDSRRFSIAAQGSYLLYESGRALIQGAGAAAWLSPSVGRVRAEVSGFGGLSRYASEAVAGYGMARGRLHALGTTRGAWVGAGLGQAYTSAVTAATLEVGAGAWLTFPGLALTVSTTHSTAAGSDFTDVTATARWNARALELTALVGGRPQSAAADEGLFGEVTAHLPLTRTVAAQVAAGYFPADPLRGAVAGRYLSAGLRLTLAGPRPQLATPVERLRADIRLPFPLPPDAPELTVGEAPIGARTLTVHATRAEMVEIAGDFTDWQPVLLRAVGRNTWELSVLLAPGVYRLNVRIDGGSWQVPRGATPQDDEFGGLVGLVVVR